MTAADSGPLSPGGPVWAYYNRGMNKKVHSARISLVDATETALRERLSPGRARQGDRLPPEKELAETLGVSRGTLRLALERLESNGEIVRRHSR